MDISMDTVGIEIETTVKSSISAIDNLIKSLNDLQGKLTDVVKTSSNFGNITKNIEKAASNVSKIKPKQQTQNTSKEQQLSNLGVSLDGAKQLQSIKKEADGVTSEFTKFRTIAGDTVTVERKMKDGVESFKTSLKQTTREGRTLAETLKNSATFIITSFKTVAGNMLRLTRTIGDFVDESAAYTEAANLFFTEMGDNADDAYKWITKLSNALYLDPTAMMQYLGSFNSLLTGLGVGEERAYKMSKNLTQLAYDLSSYKNISFESAYDKLSSGIAGQIKGLKSVGVALNINTLQERANALGIQEKVRTMSEASKAELRYIQIMQSSVNWQGDLGKTLTSTENIVRIGNQVWTQFKRALGNVAVVLVRQLLPYFIALIQLLTEAAQRLAAFFGFEIDFSDYKTATNTIASGVEDIGTAADNTTKKLNTMLAPFDDLNVVQNKNESAASGLGAAGGGGLGVDLPEYDMLSKYTGEFAKEIDNAKNKLKSLLPVIKSVGKVLLGMWALNKISTFISGVKNIGSLFKNLGLSVPTSMSKVVKGIGGVVLAGDGLLRIADNMREIGYAGKATAKETLNAAVGIGELTAGGALLAGVLFGINPLIGAIAGLGVGLIDAGVSLKNGMDDANNSLIVLSKNIVNNKQALNDYKTSLNELESSQAKWIESSLRETTQNERLLDELDNIVDSRGNVKSGYEDLASYILTELNNAYGTEYKMIDGQIQNYKDLQKEIQNTIDKKKAEILLQAQEEKYQFALEHKTELYQKQQESAKNLEKAEYELVTAEKKLSDARKKGGTVLKMAQINYDSTKRVYDEAKQSHEDWANQYKDAVNMVIDYESALKNESEGNYKAVEDSLNKLSNTTVKDGKIISNAYDGMILANADYYDKLIEQTDKNDKVMREKRIKDKEHYIKTTREQLQGQLEIVDEVTPDMVIAFSDLGKVSNEGLQGELDKLGPNAREKINNAIEEMKVFTKPVQDAFSGLGLKGSNSYINELQKIETGTSNALTKTKDTLTKSSILSQFASAGAAIGAKLSGGITNNISFDSKSISTKLAKTLKNLKIGGIAVGEAVFKSLGIDGYATGGYPDSAQLFYAREDGIPEMVGRIGNKTAVANNDQITKSITNALMSALSGVNFGGSGTTVVNIGNKKVYEGMGEHIDSESERYGTAYINI